MHLPVNNIVIVRLTPRPSTLSCTTERGRHQHSGEAQSQHRPPEHAREISAKCAAPNARVACRPSNQVSTTASARAAPATYAFGPPSGHIRKRVTTYREMSSMQSIIAMRSYDDSAERKAQRGGRSGDIPWRRGSRT